MIFRPRRELFDAVISDACMRNRFHPVRDYLDELEWDGEARVEEWLIRYFGAEDTPFNRAVGRIVLVAAVRRVRNPGEKFDEALILESPEGHGKSSAIGVLAVLDEWFSDSVSLNVSDQKMIEGLAGRWIVELAELQGMRKADIARLKAQLSRRWDRARLAYGRLPTEQPRQSVFIGTVNPDPTKASGYLASLTGNRRFWPVAIGRVDLEGIRRDRDQLWAEASKLEAAGESIRLPEKLWPMAQREQQSREVTNPFTEVLAEHLSTREGIIFSADAWRLTGIPVSQRNGHYERLGAAMRELGWIRRKARREEGAEREWAYAKGDMYEAGEDYKEGHILVPLYERHESRFVLTKIPFSRHTTEARNTLAYNHFANSTEDDE